MIIQVPPNLGSRGEKIAPSKAATPAQGRVLERRCKCGQHTVAGDRCASCREAAGTKLQRAAVTPTPQKAAPRVVDEVLDSAGQPLDSSDRAFMEPRFGFDFSRVRVHSNAKAAESARAVAAHAYTVGSDIVFGPTRYEPGTERGRKLLAHELTHVVQQGSKVERSRTLTVGPTVDPFEQQADLIAGQVVSQTAPLADTGDSAIQATYDRATNGQSTASPAPLDAASRSGVQSSPRNRPVSRILATNVPTIQRDSDSDDFKQGYQDGQSGNDPAPGPRDGDALTDYNEGYAKGHYEFSQQSSSGGDQGPISSNGPPTTPMPAPAPDDSAASPAPGALAPSQTVGPPQLKDLSVPQLDRLFNEAKQSGDWPDAAEVLNTFNRLDIQTRLSQVTPDQVTSIHQGALDNRRVGPGSQVAELTAPGTPPASTNEPLSTTTPVDSSPDSAQAALTSDAGPAKLRTIADMSGIERLVLAYERADVDAAVRAKIGGLLTEEALVKAIIGFAAGFIVAELTPVGWAANLSLAVTAVFIETALAKALKDLLAFAEAYNATTEAQINLAAAAFADAIAELKVDALILVLTHTVAKGVSGGGSSGAPPPSSVNLGLTPQGELILISTQTIPVAVAAGIGIQGAGVGTLLMSQGGGGPGGITATGAGVRGPGSFMTPDEFAKIPRSGSIDPGKIRYSQDSIQGAFKEGGDVEKLAADLKAGNVDPASIPPIRIVEQEGKIYTLDNRRLAAFQEAGIPIRYEKLDSVPKGQLFKFTTKNDGVSIEIRGRKK
jgi:hypothetical protein